MADLPKKTELSSRLVRPMDTQANLNDNDDQRAIDETLIGNSDSFAFLVRKYQDRLFTSLTHMTGSPDDAEEIAQEALLQAYRKLETFQGKSSFYTWLYRIAFNLTISRTRRKQPRAAGGWRVDSNHDTSPLDPSDPSETPSERLERQERAVQVQTALQGMTEDARQLIILREIENYDYESIAAMLDIPVGTVRSRLHRARLQLREQLQNVFEKP